MAARWLLSFRGRLVFAAAALFLAFGALLASFVAETADKALRRTMESSAQRMLSAFERGVDARIKDAGWLMLEEAEQRSRRAQDRADMGAGILDYFWELADLNPRTELATKNQALACMDQAGLVVADAEGVLLSPVSEQKKRSALGRNPSAKIAAMWDMARKEGKGVLTIPARTGDDRPPDSIAFTWQQAWNFLVAAPAPKADGPPGEAPSADRTVRELAQDMAQTPGPNGMFFWLFTGKAMLPVEPRPFGETWPAPFVSIRDTAFASLKKAAETPQKPVLHFWPSLSEDADMEVSSFVSKLPGQDAYLVASIPAARLSAGIRYRVAALVLLFAALFCLLLWTMAGKLNRELNWLADRVRALAQGQRNRLPAAPKRPFREVAKVSAALSTLEKGLDRPPEPAPAPFFGTRLTRPAEPGQAAAKPAPRTAASVSRAPSEKPPARPEPIIVPETEAPLPEPETPPAPKPALSPGKEAQSFSPEPESLESLESFIARFSAEHGVDPDTARELSLAAEEVAQAIIANKGDGLTTLNAVLSLAGRELKLIISDDGPPFDPTVAADADDEGPLPGLGRSLLVQLVDRAGWERDGEGNLTILEKSLAP